MPTVNLEFPETDYFLTVQVAASSVPRVLVVAMDAWDGLVGADASQNFIGAALCTSATESVANMDTGISLIQYNPDSGASSAFYPGTTTIYAAYPYVLVGKTVVYRLPIPAFTGADRYVILSALFLQWQGSPQPRITTYVETRPSASFLTEFTEHSGHLNDYRNFGQADFAGYQWAPGSKLILTVGSDGTSDVVHSIFPVAAQSNDMDLSALLGGTPMVPPSRANTSYNGVPGITFNVPICEVITLEFDLPTLPPTWSGWPMFRYVNNAGSDIHVSFLVRVQAPVPATTRDRTTRDRLPR